MRGMHERNRIASAVALYEVCLVEDGDDGPGGVWVGCGGAVKGQTSSVMQKPPVNQFLLNELTPALLGLPAKTVPC